MAISPASDSALRRWFRFSGRTRRAPFWTWTISIVVLVAASLALQLIPSDGDGMMWARAAGALVVIILVVTCVPNLRFLARRLHDADLSGRWVLIGGVPVLGGLILLTIALLPSNPRGARFDAQASTGTAKAPARRASGTTGSAKPSPGRRGQ